MKKDWEIKTVEEICDTLTDGNWIESKDQSSSGIRLIQTGNVGEGLFKDRESKSRYISKETFKRLNCTEIFEGDCLISRLPEPVGRACLIPKLVNRSITAVDCSILRFNKYLDPRFFIYFSLSSNYLFEVEQQCSGATRKRISRKNLGKLNIPVPPMLEQKRIVKILDEKFVKIDELKKITEQQIVDAKELFESSVDGKLSDPSSDYEEKTLKEITTIIGDGLHGTPEYTSDGKYFFINGNNLSNGKILLKDNTKKVSYDEYLKHKKLLNDRTILVSINGTLGNVAFYDGEKVILGKSACYFNLIDSVSKDYIKHFLMSPVFFKYAHKEATGATIKNVSLKTMRDLKIKLPTLDKQIMIAKEIDKLSEQTNELKAIFLRKISDLEELKKSYLQDAFAGKL